MLVLPSPLQSDGLDSPSASVTERPGSAAGRAYPDLGNYDEVMFDIGEEPPTTPSKSRAITPRHLNKSLKMKKPIKPQASWKSGGRRAASEVEEDRVSLDSYEDMNGTQDESSPAPLRRKVSKSPPPPDPSTRAKVEQSMVGSL